MAADSVLVLPEVRVERDRRGAASRRLPTAFVHELPVGGTQRAFESLADVLSRAAGVHVQQYGGLGAFSTMSLRGAPAGQVAVFLDGAPLTSAAHGVVNLADLPVTAIERVEVYRGGSPPEFGLAGPGGAVNVITAATGAPTLRATRGSFGTWEGRATTGFARGAFNAFLHGGYQGSAGDFPYLDDNATPLNAADDSVHGRNNNRFEAATALVRAGWTPRPGWRLGAHGSLFQKIQGLAGLGAIPTLHTRLDFQRALGQMEAAVEGAGRLPSWRLRAGLDRTRSRFDDRFAELGLGTHDTDDRIARVHADLGAEGAGFGPLAWGLYGTARREVARLRDAADGLADPPASHRDAWGLVARLEARFAGGRGLLFASRRWDRLADRLRTATFGSAIEVRDTDRDLVAPHVGARWSPGWGLDLRANHTRAGRAPDFLELFGNQGGVTGNGGLRHEQIEGWDAGLSWTSPPAAPVRGTIEWAYFASRAEDLILYVRNSQSSVRAQNVTRSETRGDELTLSARGPAGLGLVGAFTWLDAFDTGDVPYWTGRRLPQRPAREVSASLTWSGRGLTLTADLHHLGDNMLDRYNRYRVASRTLTGASLSWTIHPSVRLAVEGKNLGDDRIADVAGFPLPGRSVFVSCETALRPSQP